MKTYLGFAALLFGFTFTAFGQDLASQWQADSTTAMGITGDVRISAGQIVVHHVKIPLKAEQPLDAPSLAVAAKLFSLSSAEGASGSLYAVHVPANTPFKNGNTLCGRDTVTFALLLFSPPSDGNPEQVFNLAFFSGKQAPDLHTDAFTRTTSLCGTYRYAKAGRLNSR